MVCERFSLVPTRVTNGGVTYGSCGFSATQITIRSRPCRGAMS